MKFENKKRKQVFEFILKEMESFEIRISDLYSRLQATLSNARGQMDMCSF
jgi:hypothetical protein